MLRCAGADIRRSRDQGGQEAISEISHWKRLTVNALPIGRVIDRLRAAPLW